MRKERDVMRQYKSFLEDFIHCRVGPSVGVGIFAKSTILGMAVGGHSEAAVMGAFAGIFLGCFGGAMITIASENLAKIFIKTEIGVRIAHWWMMRKGRKAQIKEQREKDFKNRIPEILGQPSQVVNSQDQEKQEDKKHLRDLYKTLKEEDDQHIAVGALLETLEHDKRDIERLQAAIPEVNWKKEQKMREKERSELYVKLRQKFPGRFTDTNAEKNGSTQSGFIDGLPSSPSTPTTRVIDSFQKSSFERNL